MTLLTKRNKLYKILNQFKIDLLKKTGGKL